MAHQRIQLYFGDHRVPSSDKVPSEVSLMQAQKPSQLFYDWDQQRSYVIILFDVTASRIHWLKVGSTEVFPYFPPFTIGHNYVVSIYSNPISLEPAILSEIRKTIPSRNNYNENDIYLGSFVDDVSFVLVPNTTLTSSAPASSTVTKEEKVIFEDPKRGDKYIYVKTLGSGSTGRTYLTRLITSDGMEVGHAVLKVIQNPNKIKNAKREIAILYRLSPHKNVISILGSYYTETGVVIVLEAIDDAISLEEYITSHSIDKADKVTLLDLMSQIVDGVIHLHKHKIVHMDIKPDNIIIKTQGGAVVPIIIDYDLSCIGDSTGPDDLRCRKHTGTPVFLAPEMWLKDIKIPEKFLLADIYSLGATFYSMVNKGEQPFPGETAKEYKDAVLTQNPQPFTSGIHDLDVLIRMMMARSPDDRPSLEDVSTELSRILKSI